MVLTMHADFVGILPCLALLTFSVRNRVIY